MQLNEQIATIRKSFTGNIRLVLTAVCKDVVAPGTCDYKVGPPLSFSFSTYFGVFLHLGCSIRAVVICFHNQETGIVDNTRLHVFVCVEVQ